MLNKSNDVVSCYYQNAGSLRSSLVEFKNLVLQCVYDVIIITETWLSDDFDSCELAIQGYSLFRCDRSGYTSSKGRGGGSMLLIHNRLKPKFIVTDIHVEQCFAEFSCGKSNFVVGGVYIPPSSDADIYVLHALTVENLFMKFSTHSFVIVGDYNLPHVRWFNSSLGLTVRDCSDSAAIALAETFSYLNLYQHNNITNSRGTILDLLFSNLEEMSTSPALDLLHHNSTHHTAIVFDLTVPTTVEHLEVNVSVFDFARGNYVAINNYLNSVAWDRYLDKLNVDTAVHQFYDVLYHSMNTYIPRKIIRNSTFPHWFSHDLRAAIFRKKEAHKRYKITNSYDDYLCFSALRAYCKELTDYSYSCYLSEVETKIDTDPKFFWHFASNKSRFEFPNSMYLGSRTCDNGSDIVNLFCDNFSSVYAKCNAPVPVYNYKSNLNVSNVRVSLSEIFHRISVLKENFSCGPDGIPSYFIKKCIFSVSTPLNLIFNLSLSSGTFPDLWKCSFIRPIYKSGCSRDVCNYRGICLQSCVSKLFDSLVTDYLRWECKSLLIDQQHGFTRGRSTVTNLLSYHNVIVDAFENGCEVHSIYTDFKKAFDRVSHDLLVAKLKAYGFNGAFLNWIRSFLCGRRQCVKISNYTSDIINVFSGVPQGSHCGPLLFNLFVNDISLCIQNSQFLLFADDLKVFKVVSSIDHCLELQSDIDRVAVWCHVNGMSLNLGKCFNINFSRSHRSIDFGYTVDSHHVEAVSQVRDLGIIFDAKLTFSFHILNICLKARRALGYIQRAARSLSLKCFKVLYCAHVRSVLEYGSVVWCPYYAVYIDMLERVQHKFLRCAAYRMGILSSDYTYDYSAICSRLKIITLYNRRVQLDLCFLFKLLAGDVHAPVVLSDIGFRISSVRTRSTYTFHVENHRRNYGVNSPPCRLVREANETDLDYVGVPYHIFKRGLVILLSGTR